MRGPQDITDPRLVKALAHPLRSRILVVLEERTASPNEIAAELGEPLGNVSYHVRQLVALGLVKLVKETPRRGAIEHYYRAESRPGPSGRAWARLPESVKQSLTGATVAQISEEVNAAVIEGGFSGESARLSRIPLALDEEGRRALAKELDAVLERVERIQKRSSQRLAKRHGEIEQSTELVILAFARPRSTSTS